jgi:hypothetical protein
MTGIENTPRVDVTVTESLDRRDPYWVLNIDTCPHCAKSHRHGGGSTDHPPALGGRVSHCRSNPQMYDLIASGDAL